MTLSQEACASLVSYYGEVYGVDKGIPQGEDKYLHIW